MSIATLEQQARSQLMDAAPYAIVGFVLLSAGVQEAFTGAQLLSIGHIGGFLISASFSALMLGSGGAMTERGIKRFGAFVEKTVEASQQRLALRLLENKPPNPAS